MPITQTQKDALAKALEAFDSMDSYFVGKLLYETMLDACISKENSKGMGTQAITSFGRAIFDKLPWSELSKIEEAIGQPIRLPIIKSTDVILRTQIADALPVLAQEHRAALAAVLAEMNDLELVSLSKLVYETFCNTGFPVTTPFSGLHPLCKFLYSKLTWEDLRRRRETAEGICVALGMGADDYFRKGFLDIMGVEAPEAVQEPEIAPEIIAAAEAAEAAEEAKKNPPVVTVEVADEGGASDAEPFAPAPAEVSEAVEASSDSDESEEEAPEAPEASEVSETSDSSGSPDQQMSQEEEAELIAAIEADQSDDESDEEPASEPAAEAASEPAPEIVTAPAPEASNGHSHLTKKQRRELRAKKDKEAQS
jgi:hypothetical protein